MILIILAALLLYTAPETLAADDSGEPLHLTEEIMRLEGLRLSDPQGFSQGLDELNTRQGSMSVYQLCHFNFLKAYRTAFTGQPLKAVEDMEQVLRLDLECFGFERETFLKLWMNQPGAVAYTHKTDGILKGFALIRPLRNGFKVSPLFANVRAVATELYKACLNTHPGKFIVIDIPRNNPEALKLVEQFNAEYTFECARMYYGQPPANNWNKVFGISSFELG